MLKIYDKTNINDLIKLSNLKDNSFLNYFASMITEGTKKYIENIDCEIKILQINDKFLPLVFADDNYNDSLYVSILSHYVKYTIQEFQRFISNKLLKNFLVFILKIFEKIFIANKINKVLYVNHYLVSTNLYPDITQDEIKQIIEFLKETFPDYAIAFKNINKFYDCDLHHKLILSNCSFIVSRQIFLLDKEIKSTLKSKYLYKINNEIKLLNNSLYKITNEIFEEEYCLIEELYTKLYVEKYSKYNPKYTKEYFKLVRQSKIFDINVLKMDEKICAASILQGNSRIMTIPALGYDMSISKNLYSLINAQHLKIFDYNFEIFNLSAGIADYKMQRGAKPVIEYMAIYYKHLKFNRQFVYKILEKAVNITIPILCKKRLCGFVPSKL